MFDNIHSLKSILIYFNNIINSTIQSFKSIQTIYWWYFYYNIIGLRCIINYISYIFIIVRL